MNVWVPYERYDGLPWDIYIHIFWEQMKERGLTVGIDSYVKKCMVESALAIMDRSAAEQFLRDWALRRCGHRERIAIKKYIPGEHYNVLGKKFDDLWAAMEYARDRGYSTHVERHTIRLDGD